ncbi:hypothetical protein Ciccas_011829 [Cichlidogyrus casuarinus]|uniref:Uncharacterized protein n=1 Tax=Cichlidogyrus casuarinus TaxID=1844966 RepID=A0ABD2PQS8_9PLAT
MTFQSTTTNARINEDFDKVFDQMYEFFSTSAAWRTYEDVVPALDSLDVGNLSIISNSDERIVSILKSLDLHRYFDAIIYSSGTPFMKPDPHIFRLLASQANNIDLPKHFHCGDLVEKDVRGAILAGCQPVLIDRKSDKQSHDFPAVKDGLIRGCHWVMGRILILHTFCLLMLFAERSAREDRSPISFTVMYVQIAIACLCTLGHYILPKRLMQLTIAITAASHLGLVLSLSTNPAWKLTTWLKYKWILKAIASAAVYIRLLGGNTPLGISQPGKLGLSMLSMFTLFTGLLSIPLSLKFTVHAESQQFELSSIWSPFRFHWLQISNGIAFMFMGLAYSLPLIVPVLETQAEKFHRLIWRVDALLATLTLFNLILKDSNLPFVRANNIDRWMQALWIINDLTLVVGLAVVNSMFQLQPQPEKPKCE